MEVQEEREYSSQREIQPDRGSTGPEQPEGWQGCCSTDTPRCRNGTEKQGTQSLLRPNPAIIRETGDRTCHTPSRCL